MLFLKKRIKNNIDSLVCIFLSIILVLVVVDVVSDVVLVDVIVIDVLLVLDVLPSGIKFILYNMYLL